MKKTLWIIVALIISISCSNQKTEKKATEALPDLSIAPEEIAKKIVDLSMKGDHKTVISYFDSTMKVALPEEKLKDTWDGIFKQTGSFLRRTEIKSQEQQGYKTYFVTCEFEKGKLDVKIIFNKDNRIAGFWVVPHQESYEYNPPSYVNKSAFEEKDVTVGTGEWALPGTLTIPKEGKYLPALVLVHGSGPNDRDETLGPNKVFKDLAWGLASNGIVVLRYDKRTKVYASKMVSLKNLKLKDEVDDDAIQAVNLLLKTDRIDKKKIFVLGHSLGGMVVPRIGSESKDIAGIIIMAGSTRFLGDVMLEQMNYIYNLDGKISPEEQKSLDEIKKMIAKVKSGELKDKSDQNLMGAPASYWLDLLDFKPTEIAKGLKIPILVLQGARDYQVPMEDYKNWQTALSGNKNVEFRLYDDLNHLFIQGKGKSKPEEYQLSGHFDVRVIKDIADWIKKH